MTYWSAWLGGLALALVALTHWLTVRRMLAVSGRFTQLVNRLREGPPAAVDEAMTEEQLIAAVQAMALAEFGAEAIEEAAAASSESAAEERRAPATPLSPQPLWLHGAFLAALVVGGLLASVTGGGVHLTAGIGSPRFEALFGSGASGYGVLLFGGVLVGWGTRMAGGCTSGHGLCGVSRLQPGSLLATAAFFGTGIAVSLLLEVLS